MPARNFIQNKKQDKRPAFSIYIIPSLRLEGSETASAVLNDSPVGCQTRGVTEPQRDRCQRS